MQQIAHIIPFPETLPSTRVKFSLRQLLHAILAECFSNLAIGILPAATAPMMARFWPYL